MSWGWPRRRWALASPGSILDESLPSEVTLFELASATPLLWDEQWAIIGRDPQAS